MCVILYGCVRVCMCGSSFGRGRKGENRMFWIYEVVVLVVVLDIFLYVEVRGGNFYFDLGMERLKERG